MADNNPANFANLPKDKLHDIAAKGGHASHGGGSNSKTEESHQPGRNPDGTFTKGSNVASELGHEGAIASNKAQGHDVSGSSGGNTTGGAEDAQAGRNPDGTFTKGSEVAKELGHEGGLAAHSGDSGAQGGSGGVESADGSGGRNPDGTFKKGSELASELGAAGGHAS